MPSPGTNTTKPSIPLAARLGARSTTSSTTPMRRTLCLLKTLLAVADSSADRVGYHKRSTKENINVDFAARLEAAITRSRSVKVIEHEE